MSENQQALQHVVSMEDLTVDQVLKLIKRGIEFKNGAVDSYENRQIVANLFLKVQPVPINHSKLLKLNLDWTD